MFSPQKSESPHISYDEALRQADREAAATLTAAVFVTAFFWLAVFLLRNAQTAWWGIPLWAWAAIGGGYLVSIAAVWFLTARICRNFSLDIHPEKPADKGERA